MKNNIVHFGMNYVSMSYYSAVCFKFIGDESELPKISYPFKQ